jgi:hypothetical protein
VVSVSSYERSANPFGGLLRRQMGLLNSHVVPINSSGEAETLSGNIRNWLPIRLSRSIQSGSGFDFCEDFDCC